MKITCLFLAWALAAMAQNIKDYGAVGDGVHDDTAAIQKAFDALDARRGGTVHCPVGAYAVSKTITVRGDSVRFAGDGGSATNEGPKEPRGCTLLAKTNGMTLLNFEGEDATGHVNHHGPTIEYVNFRDATPDGHTATLLRIGNYNYWTVRNVSVNYANVGLKIDGVPTGDASWGYVPQLICVKSNYCLDSARGGFVAIGGAYMPLKIGIRAAWPQMRVIGAKFDCAGPGSGSIGVETTGHGNLVEGSAFEGQCAVAVKIHSANTKEGAPPMSGCRNRVVGCHFFVGGGRPLIGVEIGDGDDVVHGFTSNENMLIGNTYDVWGPPNYAVVDKGVGTMRYDDGMGAATVDLSCPAGQVLKSIKLQAGIVTGVMCGAL